ncbi:hypothetical protein [Bythopirellula polymerisocia]|uniref:Beta-hexosaminidase bacterial type N-terminal domain-containing protein n=1 Tax=Bythopirellula polymerisocia TaxID=2528003 RepID=A0A5C6CQV1_9BACT|nr:hypothetical protein [Bythopirellula polymerisocia]TWU25917.1 hypothetical protein Pla144_31310 [Bythopirellula polymerisocia]
MINSKRESVAHSVAFFVACALIHCQTCQAENPPNQISEEYFQAYDKCPFSVLSKDYFARFNRDCGREPSEKEVLVDRDWRILYSNKSNPLTSLMASYLKQFLNERMQLSVSTSEVDGSRMNSEKAIILMESGGGDPEVSESFTITAKSDKIIIAGQDYKGLRDGIVRFASLIGLERAPVFALGEQIFKPRIAIRVSDVPWMGSYRDVIFGGFNAVILTGSIRDDVFEAVSGNIGSLRMLSQSDAIAELKKDQDPAVLSRLKCLAKGARENGLKVYIYLHLKPRIQADDPIFQAHPEIRGALIADGPPYDKYHLCTSHPLVRQYLSESVQSILKEIPYIDGIVIIVGGEEFLHCFMRPYQVPARHETNCQRCDKRGLEAVLSELCDYLGDAARQVSPNAEVLAWPYSAVHYWNGHQDDRAQLKFIEALKPGTALFTDVVKDDYVEKPGGIRKLMWDYSIDEPGPGQRVFTQIEACHSKNRKIYIHSEPELAFEISRLPYIASMDRWAQRGEGIAASHADGVFVWSFFRPDFGTTSREVFQHFWWESSDTAEVVLEKLAVRIAGNEAGRELRKAWKHTSEAVGYSPVIDDYLSGPMYLGPAHPMCADPEAQLPDGFDYGVYKSPVKSGVFESDVKGQELFLKYFRQMEQALVKAVDAIDRAENLVPEERQLNFEAEAMSVRWFYHAARTAANFHESCILRDKILHHISSNLEPNDQIQQDYKKWRGILIDEKQNAVEALPLMKKDMRLDFYYGHNGVGKAPHKHGTDMIKMKIELIDDEITGYLPDIAKKLNLSISG